jgi:predicted ArsR family transcriptional regulator
VLIYTGLVDAGARKRKHEDVRRSGARTAYEVLAVASRALILEQVRKHPEGIDATTLANRIGLHPNTVRFHLEVLVEAGMVRAFGDPVRKPGRPRLLFSAVRVPPPAPENGMGPGDRDGYALLAAVLARHLARVTADPGGWAESAGRLFGAEQLSALDVARSEVERVAAVTALLAEVGFAPETIRDGDNWRILLHRCPFHALAAEQPDIVCRLHLGLLQGAVDRLGGTGGTVRLEPFVAPGLCEAFVPIGALGGSVPRKLGAQQDPLRAPNTQ